jgi:hypothetical protein
MAKDPITASMREALARINKVHGGMSAKVIDEAVEAFHKEVARQDPKVFVPLAVPHLMRLAPHDTQTRILLRKALDKGWLDEDLARMYLVQSGDTPAPHIQALDKGLEVADRKARIRAIRALGGCGALAEPALPKLRDIVAKANAPKEDYRRAYTSADKVPEHVHADWAIKSIESAIEKRKP